MDADNGVHLITGSVFLDSFIKRNRLLHCSLHIVLDLDRANNFKSSYFDHIYFG